MDPIVDDAVSQLDDRVTELEAEPGDRARQETVCLASRYALSLFLPAWLEERVYEPAVVELFRQSLKRALAVLDADLQYAKSVRERQEELEEFLSGKRQSLMP